MIKTKNVLTYVLMATSLTLFQNVVSANEEAQISRGAQLYDKWYKVIGDRAPKKSHKLYPAAKKYAKKPKSNWRCKECHGWDTMGVDGAYKSGKHSTGIKGINGMRGASTSKIIAALKSKDHGFNGRMRDRDFQDLALFISKGQTDYDKYINRASKKPKGNSAKGETYYQTICAGCHGVRGFKIKDMLKSFKKQMGNPWEVMHKILNGQPDESMPALRALDPQISVDIMSYMLTMPAKK